MKNKKIKNIRKNLIFSLFVVALVVLVVFLVGTNIQKEKIQEITSFQGCVDAGYIIQESYPRQCRTSEKILFIEEIQGKAINFTDLSNALSNPNLESKQELIFWNESSFKETFKESTLQIDFQENIVLAVFSGMKTSGGYSIELTRIEETSDSLKVLVTEVSPSKNCMVTMAITYPFNVVQIPKTEKTKIEFFYNYESREC